MGRAVLTDPHIDVPAHSAKSVLFGDLAAFYVREAGPMRFEASADFAWDSDIVMYRCLARVDSGLADPSAVKFGVQA